MRYFFVLFLTIIFFSCRNYEGIDITKPSAYINSPKNGDLVSDSLLISAIGSDDIGIDYIELWINQEKTQLIDNSPPYEFIIDTRSLNDIEEGGVIELSVKAYDTSENESPLSTIVEVFTDNENPSKVVLNPIINKDGQLKFSWSQCGDLDFYAYVVMNNSVDFERIDSIFYADEVERIISNYTPNSTDEFKIKVIDKGQKESISNSVKPVKFDFITFEPESNSFSFGPNNDETPAPSDFELMTSEVTNLQYQSYLKVAKELNYIDTTNIGPWVMDYEGNILYDLENGYVKWNGQDFYIDGITSNYHIPEYPVIYVSWIGATKFAEFFGFRLPSDIEWEFAAGNLGQFDYPWGRIEDTQVFDEIQSFNANYFQNEIIDGLIEPYEPGNGINDFDEPGLAPVSRYQEDIVLFWFYDTCPNECNGLNHMAGNVWEWVNYDGGYPGSRKAKGGSWRSAKQDLKIWSTKILESHSTGDHIGFRCAKDLF